MALFTPAQTGLARFSFTVTDAAGATSTRLVNIVVDSSIATIENQQASCSLNCYPNPATGFLKVSFVGDNNSTGDILITDTSGKTMLRKQVTGVMGQTNLTLDVSSLPAGNYFATVKTGIKSQTVKVVKQ